MFWGVTLENGKRYSQVVDMPVCITMASLEPSTVDASKAVSVMIEHEKSEFLLCTLMHDKIPQQPLDLQFVEGEEVTFFLNGQGIVHLSGYSAEGDDHEMDESEEDSDEEEDSSLEIDEDEIQALDKELGLSGRTMKRKILNQSSKNAKKLKNGIDEDDDTETDDDDDDEDLFVKTPTKGKGPQQTPKKTPGPQASPKKLEQKTPKGGQGTPKGGQGTPKGGQGTPKGGQQTPKVTGQQSPKTPAVNGNSAGDETGSSKKKRRNKKNKTPQQSPTPTKEGNQQKTPAKQVNSESESKSPITATPKKGKAQKLASGVSIEDVTVGNGPVAKNGMMVQVYYKGTLTNGKEFDSQEEGKPFRFRLGKEEVIKGWDIGIQGMKVGGRRKIVVPSNQAYGSKAVGTIPPNSTLVFNVRLLAVK